MLIVSISPIVDSDRVFCFFMSTTSMAAIVKFNADVQVFFMIYELIGAPTGGPGYGRSRIAVGTHPHPLVVGASNHIAVLCLARLGALDGVNLEIPIIMMSNCREAMYGGLLKITYVCYHRQDLQLGLSDFTFQDQTSLKYRPPLIYLFIYILYLFLGGRVFHERVASRRVRPDQGRV
jgi:hypothetical protein